VLCCLSDPIIKNFNLKLEPGKSVAFTIKQCDRIIVLDQGKIMEDGSYEQLIAQEGYFSELIASQRLGETGFVEVTTAY
jgi:ABC-type bacteriocin/lantibiotic exporters, contain an N-terminal double-glycine peptidase domain